MKSHKILILVYLSLSMLGMNWKDTTMTKNVIMHKKESTLA